MKLVDPLDAELAGLLAREKKLKAIRVVQIRIQKIEATLERVAPEASKTLLIIGQHVSADFGVSWDQIMAKTKLQYICDARQVVCYLAREFGVQLADCGRQLRLDHGTVHYSHKKIRDRMSVDARFKVRIEGLEKLCRAELKKEGIIE